MLNFQQLILKLQSYWGGKGCALLQPYDMEMGAGTFHTATFLRAIGPEPWRAAYVQPSRRPKDGRYGDNPNRLQHYYQYQVVLKPSPDDIQDLYLDSLRALGFNLKQHDVRFVEDDWESPTLGAWGLGWEVWLDGMEISQFTYFQQAGGIDLAPISAEITYGLERIAMFLSKVDSIYDIRWNEALSYGQVRREDEVELSRYAFETADTQYAQLFFDHHEREGWQTLAAGLVRPAYEAALACSHQFNILDARGAVSATDRVGLIRRVRDLACACARAYAARGEAAGSPSPGPEPAPAA